MKYLKIFETEAAYTASTKEETQVSYLEDIDEVRYDKAVEPARKINLNFYYDIRPDLIELTNAEFSDDKTEIIFNNPGAAEVKINNIGGYDNAMGFLMYINENSGVVTYRWSETGISTITISDTSKLVVDMTLNISCLYVDPANPDVNLSLKITGGDYMYDMSSGYIAAEWRQNTQQDLTPVLSPSSEQLLAGYNFTIKSGWPVTINVFNSETAPADASLYNVRFTPALPDGWTFRDFTTKGVPPMNFAMEADYDWLLPEDYLIQFTYNENHFLKYRYSSNGKDVGNMGENLPAGVLELSMTPYQSLYITNSDIINLLIDGTYNNGVLGDVVLPSDPAFKFENNRITITNWIPNDTIGLEWVFTPN